MMPVHCLRMARDWRNYSSIRVPQTNSWQPNLNLTFWKVPALEPGFH